MEGERLFCVQNCLGQASYFFGRWLSIYGSPSCKAAVWFKCAETKESSTESEKYLSVAVEHFRSAILLRPTEQPPISSLYEAYKSMNDLSSAVDLIEKKCVLPTLD